MRWPPLIWPAISLASLLILVGIGGKWNPEGFIPGLAIVLIGCGFSLYLAYGRRGDRPPPRGVAWLVPLTAGFYAAAGAAAAFAGGAYVLAAAAAALIPLTASALIDATARRKGPAADGDHEDPFPGIGPDEDTPLGDTSEHSEAERVGPPRRARG
jgi:hypothetical protein